MFNLPFPLKVNQKFDIQGPMKTYVEAYHGMQEYKDISGVIAKIQQLRN